ncbi:MAG: hypothetical protein KDD27_13765 [Saprospiraceae bacterium]|nr:hypothetical protein [Saprospiraceae bacterium]
MRALLIIGLQIDLAPGGALDMPGGETVAAKARELMAKHDLVVAARQPPFLCCQPSLAAARPDHFNQRPPYPLTANVLRAGQFWGGVCAGVFGRGI